MADRYELGGELGRGGMGQVYAATDQRLGREVAIKVLLGAAHDERRLRRFEQEARAAGGINHPNIVTVYDVVMGEGGPFLVTELLEGETLGELLRRGPLDVTRALELGRQLAEGLGAAHAKGVVHRDLKPANLFVTGSGLLKILDFGIAKLIDGGDTGPRTQEGAVLGSAGYMAPEQLRGDEADERSDVFAAGVLLYEMLAGASPFRAVSRHAMEERVLRGAHDELPASVPQPLREVVQRCLANDPADRFQSAAQLAEALKVKDESGGAAATPAAGVKWTRLAALLGGALIAALAAVAFVQRSAFPVVSNGDAERARSAPLPVVAVADFVNETGQPALDGLAGLLSTSLQSSKRLSVLTYGRTLDLLKQIEGAALVERVDEHRARALGRLANVRALVLGNIRRFGATYALDVKVLDPVEDRYLAAAVERAGGEDEIPAAIDRLGARIRESLGEPGADVATAAVPVARSTTAKLEAYTSYFKGQQLLSQHRVRDALAAFRQASEIDPQFALARYAEGTVFIFTAERAEGEQRAAFEAALRLGLPDKEACLAQAMLERRRSHLVASLEACATRFPDEKAIVFAAGDWRFHSADLAGALGYLERAFRLDPTVAVVVDHLVSTLHGLGRVDRMREVAEEFARRSVSRRKAEFLAIAYETAGQRQRAETVLREGALAFPEDVLPHTELAMLHFLRGEPAKAEAALQPVIAGRFVGRAPGSPMVWGVILDVYRGRFASALDTLARAERRGGDAVDPTFEMWRGPAYWRAMVLAQGRRDLAAARAIAASPALARMHDARVQAWLFVDDPERASALLAGSSGAVIDISLELRIEAERARLRGDAPAAIAKYRHLAALPNMVDARFRAAELLLGAGRPREALEELRRVQTTHPGGNQQQPVFALWHPRSFYLAGRAHEALGEKASALREYDHFLGLWRDADADLIELRDAREHATALRR